MEHTHTVQPQTAGRASRRQLWTLAIVSVGLFMVVLDNLVVSVALASIHRQLGRLDPVARMDRQRLCPLVRGAPADRRGTRGSIRPPADVRRRRLAVHRVLGRGCARAEHRSADPRPRLPQGIGAAIVTPLTLTLLAEAFPAHQRGLALGIWSGISGIAVALGPLVGGAVIQAASWHWIFWINVPVGLVLAPLAARMLSESHGPSRDLDLRGLALASSGSVRDRVRPDPRTDDRLDGRRRSCISFALGAVLIVGFVLNERASHAPDAPAGVLRAAQLRGHERRLDSRCTSACSARSSS